MSEPTTYQTADGAAVTLGFIINASNQPTHIFDCDGCDGRRGFKTAEQADAGAKQHAERCTGPDYGYAAPAIEQMRAANGNGKIRVKAAFACGDRVTFPDRRHPARLPWITGTVLFTWSDKAMVQYDRIPGWPPNTSGDQAIADLKPLAETPQQHAEALLRATDWFRHHPNNYRPETVTTAVDPAAASALAALVGVLQIPPHVLFDELDARYGVPTEGGA
jgi:hypothetical protein